MNETHDQLTKLHKTKPWWLHKGNDLANAIWDHVEALEFAQEWMYDLMLKHNYIYTNDGSCGIDWRLRSQPERHEGWGMMTMNATQSVVDTVAAIIAQNRARPVVQTEGGDWSLQNQARQVSRFLEGVWDECKAHVEELKMFYDSLIFDLGAMKVFDDDGRIGIEHVPIYDLRWDEREGRSGHINSIHQLRWVDAYWLAEQDFVDDEGVEKIAEAMLKASDCRVGYDQTYENGTVLVVESWRVGGKHTWTIEGYTLFEEDWKLDRLPFVFNRWRRRPSGFRGQGLVQELWPLQKQLNRSNNVIIENQSQFGAPTWLVAHNSRISHTDINNIPGNVINYMGGPQNKPELAIPQTVSSETYAYEDRIYTRMFEKAGVSRHSAFGSKDPSLQSGIAIREAVDVETQRFAISSQTLQDTRVELAELCIIMAKEIYGRTKHLTVTYKAGDYVRTIPWGDLEVLNKPFYVTIQTASILSRTSAGRKQDVLDFYNAGLFTADEAKKLINHPDVTREMDVLNSAAEHAEWVVDELSEGRLPAVEPDMGLEMTIRRVMAERLRAVRGHAPSKITEAMLRWQSRAQFLLDRAMQLQMQQMMAQQAQAQGFSEAESGGSVMQGPPQMDALAGAAGVA